jgi:hypothetical protein
MPAPSWALAERAVLKAYGDAARDIVVDLAPGSGATLSLAIKRYAHAPTAELPAGITGSE